MRSISALSLLAIPAIATAHPSFSTNPVQANKSTIITVGLSHGCTDAANKTLDTIKIEIKIPTGVASVRPMRSDFGKPKINRSGTTVTSIEWTKPSGELLDADDAYYEFKFRARVPDMP